MDDIRRWFLEHEDGDFVIPPRDHPYSVVPPAPSSPGIVYTTKPRSLLVPLTDGAGLPFGVIGRYGLPSESDVHWLRTVADGYNLLFVGDVDPCDLLIFSWLRSRMDISFRGLNDTVLTKCGVALTDPVTIKHSAAEAAALPFVAQCLPDCHELLGPECNALLSSGCKVEVEALVSFATVGPRHFWQAMVIQY